MCGIFGVLGQDDDFEHGLAAIRHRGPDSEGTWQDRDAGIWLGHARLAIIDTSPAGYQPMTSSGGRYMMTYNGEIYNFAELRHELKQSRVTFVGDSDSEVLLSLFMHEGSAAFKRLRGNFAAAFWDRTDRRLTLVRDSMGVKPVYWAHTNGVFAFASEIKALVRGKLITPQINPRGLLRYLGLLWAPGTETILAGVNKLLPGTYLEVAAGSEPIIRRYADTPMPDLVKSDRSIAELIVATRDMVDAAVQRQLVSDVPLGAFLSGGLDSSAIVAFAARSAAADYRRFRCFTVEAPAQDLEAEGFADDLPYARQVAKALDVDLDVVPTDRSMMDRLPSMLYHLDEPTADPSALSTLLIAQHARAEGIKVLLSGTGGDDVFTGYRRHYAVLQERKWSWLPPFVRRGVAKSARELPQNYPISRRISKAFRNADQPRIDRLLSYFLWIDRNDAIALLSEELRAQVVIDDMFDPMRQTLSRLPESTAPLDQMLYLECNHFLADHNLNYADKMSMACGVETRVPLLDEDLVRFAASLPVSCKQRGRAGKWIFKKAMEGILPSDVIYRPKTGFGVPLRIWLKGPLRPLVEDTLAPQRLRDRGLFAPEAVRTLLQDVFAGRSDAAYTVFAIICIELWCKQFIDGNFSIDDTFLSRTGA